MIIEKLIAEINEKLEDINTKYLQDFLTWGENRKAALVAFKASDEYKELRRGRGRFILRCGISAAENLGSRFSITEQTKASSKTLRNLLRQRLISATFLIVKKLNAAGVTEILTKEYVRTNDGFRGTFIVNTNIGKKTVTIDVIVAGGYNIQCLHNRTLVKVR